MSLHLEFEPHSWYMGFAIQDWGKITKDNSGNERGYRWQAYTDDGNTYMVDELEADTLEKLKWHIRRYHLERHTGYGERLASSNLDMIRQSIKDENISYGEIAELQGYYQMNYIKADDIELLQWADAPERII